MITLTSITDPAKLQEYYRFRYRIYNESRNRVFLQGEVGIDRDGHDVSARHFGWYVDGQLGACQRLLPIRCTEDLYLIDVLDQYARTAVHEFLAAQLGQGYRVMEGSRTCLAPRYRSIANAKQLVLAIVAASHGEGYDHGLFGCDRSQAAFYLRLGFELIEGASSIAIEGTGLTKCIMKYDYTRIVERNREALQTAALAMHLVPLAA